MARNKGSERKGLCQGHRDVRATEYLPDLWIFKRGAEGS